MTSFDILSMVRGVSAAVGEYCGGDGGFLIHPQFVGAILGIKNYRYDANWNGKDLMHLRRLRRHWRKR